MTTDQIAAFVGCVLSALVAVLLFALFKARKKPPLVSYRVTRSDGMTDYVDAIEGYQVTHDGSLSFWNQDRNLSVCFAAGQWTRVDRDEK